jgi:hypothetical protein
MLEGGKMLIFGKKAFWFLFLVVATSLARTDEDRSRA